VIPYRNDQFDLIFSSNVLEHIDDLDGILRETRRVLKADGVAVHILPTPAWRLWTSVAHYGYLLQRILDAGRPVGDGSVPSLNDKLHSNGVVYAVRRILAAGPHGHYRNALSELYYFCERRWLKVFRHAGFQIAKVQAGDIFYTGYGLLPRVSLGTRRAMARWLGAATRIYVLRKA
jgi:SAM-dependent methyltransferase